MLVVSDTTAITSLLKIRRTDILANLFNEVMIAEAVRDELLRYHASIPAFFQVRAVTDKGLLSVLLESLEEGEAESIALAAEIGAAALLIDDRKGRRIAEQRGIHCLGLAGVVLLAKRKGIISSLGTFLDDLEREARFYLAAELKHELLRRAGE